jgi:hypothetical protein
MPGAPFAILIATHEVDPKTRRKQLVSSHGIELATGRQFPVSQDHPLTP